jgi:hypothetical protein
MKASLIVIACLVAASSTLAAGSHSKRGHIRKDGTYVEPSRATNPNATKLDNYSTKGNVNPYTGKNGSVDPYAPKVSKGKK